MEEKTIERLNNMIKSKDCGMIGYNQEKRRIFIGETYCNCTDIQYDFLKSLFDYLWKVKNGEIQEPEKIKVNDVDYLIEYEYDYSKFEFENSLACKKKVEEIRKLEEKVVEFDLKEYHVIVGLLNSMEYIGNHKVKVKVSNEIYEYVMTSLYVETDFVTPMILQKLINDEQYLNYVKENDPALFTDYMGFCLKSKEMIEGLKEKSKKTDKSNIFQKIGKFFKSLTTEKKENCVDVKDKEDESFTIEKLPVKFYPNSKPKKVTIGDANIECTEIQYYYFGSLFKYAKEVKENEVIRAENVVEYELDINDYTKENCIKELEALEKTVVSFKYQRNVSGTKVQARTVPVFNVMEVDNNQVKVSVPEKFFEIARVEDIEEVI